jgi:hypothetical protein
MLVATLTIGVVSELLREAKMAKAGHWMFQSDVWSSAYLVLQMGISYTLMLVVMLFDFWVVLAACVGLGLGHFAGRKWWKRLSAHRQTHAQDGSAYLLAGSGPPDYRTSSPINTEFSRHKQLVSITDTSTPCCRV